MTPAGGILALKKQGFFVAGKAWADSGERK